MTTRNELEKYSTYRTDSGEIIDWLIDWLMFNANFSSISALSWREQILFIYLDTYG